MKNKNFRNYSIVWLVCLIVFNAIIFAIPNEIMGIKRFDNSIFWISYALIIATFISQLLITLYIIKTASTKEKLFYKIPIIRMSFIILISSIIVGLVFMIITKIPSWIGIIACALTLLVYVIYCISAFTASSQVEKVNLNTKTKTEYFKQTTLTAENLISFAKSEIAKKETKKVCELFKYCDHVSNNELQNIENEIKYNFELFSNAVKSENEEEIILYSNKLNLLINDRNAKAKIIK